MFSTFSLSKREKRNERGKSLKWNGMEQRAHAC